jgi:hypothetical protein
MYKHSAGALDLPESGWRRQQLHSSRAEQVLLLFNLDYFMPSNNTWIMCSTDCPYVQPLLIQVPAAPVLVFLMLAWSCGLQCAAPASGNRCLLAPVCAHAATDAAAGQATCKRTMEVVEQLNNTHHLEKIHYFM